jgi:hypothetical protein
VFELPSSGLSLGNCTVYATTHYYNALLMTNVTLRLSRLVGDLNGDGAVNLLNAIILGKAFLSMPGDPDWNPNADLNSDNVVNVLDAIMMANHFGAGS